MDLCKFEDCLDQYGADFSKWPQEVAILGEAFMLENTQAMISFQQALEVELFLKQSPDVPVVTSSFEERIIAQARYEELSRIEQYDPVAQRKLLKKGFMERFWDLFSTGFRPVYTCCFMIFLASSVGYGVGFSDQTFAVGQTAQTETTENIFASMEDPMVNWLLWGQDSTLLDLEAE